MCSSISTEQTAKSENKWEEILGKMFKSIENCSKRVFDVETRRHRSFPRFLFIRSSIVVETRKPSTVKGGAPSRFTAMNWQFYRLSKPHRFPYFPPSRVLLLPLIYRRIALNKEQILSRNYCINSRVVPSRNRSIVWLYSYNVERQFVTSMQVGTYLFKSIFTLLTSIIQFIYFTMRHFA